MNLSKWKPSTRLSSIEPIKIEKTLYELEGPAIFTSRVGLDLLLFFKVEERASSDVFLVARTSTDEVAALENGAVSVRGILQKDENWLLELDLEDRILGFDRKSSDAFLSIMPPTRLPLYSHFEEAPDVVSSSTTPLVFKFTGPALSQRGMPLSVFKGLVESVYESVRRSIVPPSLRSGRNIELLDFPVRNLEFRSLLIPLGHPEIDETLLRRRNATKDLLPTNLIKEAEVEGARFAENVERTIEKASGGSFTKSYAREQIGTLRGIADIIPHERTDFSSMYFSSNLNLERFSAYVDREVGDRIYETYKAVRGDPKTIVGRIVGQTQKSKRLLIRNRFGRETTVYLAPTVYDSMLAEGNLFIGQNLEFKGDLEKRSDRDLLKSDGRPKILA